MKINAGHNSNSISAGSRSPQANTRPATTQAPKTEAPRSDAPKTDAPKTDGTKTDDKSKDGVEVSEEGKDVKKDDKCEKCEGLKDLLEALKDMFGDKDDDKDKKDEQPKSPCSGGGGGACNKAGGAAPTEPDKGGTDPISKLKDAVRKVESAQGPDKKKAVQELKDLYEKTKESDVEIPEKLKERIEKALGHQPRGGASANGMTAPPGHAPIQIPTDRPN